MYQLGVDHPNHAQHLLRGYWRGVTYPDFQYEIIKSLNEENKGIPNIVMFNNSTPNTLFHSQIPVPRSSVSFPSYKGKPQFPIYPFLTLHLLGILLIVTCALATNLAPPCFEPQRDKLRHPSA